ncbi:oxygen-insensitive NADPH nitroreductase [Virgibacillus sp. JSM 102003]|uniref:oxygen-insensitive NADPH nitroreductase n=1 Tax=Virgibacillus sp. JSM 102003 TaxID=1562108 RepID=UPI0035BF6FEB
MIDKPEAIQLIESHRSIRKFLDKQIDEEILDSILHSACWAPTSHNMQAYSIIVIKDKSSKDILSELCGDQRYIRQCPVFLVICADFHKLHLASEKQKEKMAIDELENVIVGSVDAALVAQNVLLGARSHKLGGVMIGGIRNNTESVAELLELPKHVFPVMGMCLGYPDQQPWQKPRFPAEAVIHKEKYQINKIPDALEKYDEIISDYYNRRTNGTRTHGWSEQLAEYISKPRRKKLTDFIKEQGFDIK